MPRRTLLTFALVFTLCLACGGAADPQAVSASKSPNQNTGKTVLVKGVDIPIGKAETRVIESTGALSVSYGNDDVRAELARLDTWATKDGWEEAWTNSVPFEDQYVYHRGDKRLVISVHDAKNHLVVNVVDR